jgi:EAL domain-containing protein (putative c-di-GMP-specific phosphodiesterase class I)
MRQQVCGHPSWAQISAVQLSDGILDREFSIVWQPIVSLHTLATISREALIRWQSPLFGSISPDVFIPVAEKNGAIELIDRWVLSRACSEAAALPGLHRFSVNVSAISLADDRFYRLVRILLDQYEIQADRLEIEITERISTSEISRKHLMLLSNLGVRIALDDFGAGFSCLNSLTALPIRKIKLDRLFMQSNILGTRERILVNSIVKMAHELSLDVCVEGVENLSHLLDVQMANADEAQGYFFGRPESFGSLVEQQKPFPYIRPHANSTSRDN